ncbi:FAD-dependent monooxygenase [Aureimonas frigidaquae]|uniref:Putative salicylate 1-monooxygenase n=1 Tax=Aureimonas frigidaquae TaxID=424757 RepID=A0A0N7KXX4_9HYPH|nr:FAD-dependent monooxygenase [Aureimonas frigidaquae]BAT28129.1 putative salicylate 1-monooxygenase [Aureimonas frigidaquae]
MTGSIAVAGAGVAGLTMALCLARTGRTVSLYERAAQIEPVGAGIQLSPNALRVLTGLGLLPALEALGVSARHVTLRDGRTGARLADIPVLAGDGTPYLSIHRADLQEVLLGAARAEPRITLSFGARLTGLVPGSDGIDLSLETADGTLARRHPLLVAADGLNSAVASALGLPGPHRSRYAAWRILAPAQDGAALSGIEAYLHARWHAVVYPVHGGRTTNLVLIAPVDSLPPSNADRAALSAALAGAAPALGALVERGTFVGCWPMAAAPQNRPYTHGDRIALLGDAAHAMLPFAAQGAAMGIEDAAVLAAALSATPDTGAALRRYEFERRPRLARVLRRVAFHDRVYHMGPAGALARNLVMRLTPPARLSAGLSWLYDWQPPEIRAVAFETPPSTPS